METRRWTNPHQPQTLQVAVILLYISAVFQLIFPSWLYASFGARLGAAALVSLLAAAAMGAGAFGIANDRKWGYNLAVAVTGVGVFELLIQLSGDLSRIVSPSFLLLALFPVARFALLVHPMSRQHQRIWFQ
ncbi:hypothetical protein [Actinomarinicola tropica]|uniref:Uncharacterized protein n=1 Tax=Actinomarinicola tropica TaxID=2789776 RepID=A0A5Q2RF92_9ACTN|nr:hypothetical protein [Actinomarinicola tropica]QGG95518.1 hypothetical protein GH723_10645 [Actinomarinicola tropica]